MEERPPDASPFLAWLYLAKSQTALVFLYASSNFTKGLPQVYIQDGEREALQPLSMSSKIYMVGNSFI